jgi:SAM-dependent methyltransferase
MTVEVRPAAVDAATLRRQIQEKYTEVALTPEVGFHFHTGRSLALMLGYDDAIIDWLPTRSVESFAGTGNPFSMGRLNPGETVLDVGCGAGFDTLIAAQQVGSAGRVIAVDMTDAMLKQAAASVSEMGLTSIDLRKGMAEDLPVAAQSVDVVISNGVINLCPDKVAVMTGIYRVLRPGGRFQIADIIVNKEVPQDAKDDIDLWSG